MLCIVSEPYFRARASFAEIGSLDDHLHQLSFYFKKLTYYLMLMKTNSPATTHHTHTAAQREYRVATHTFSLLSQKMRPDSEAAPRFSARRVFQ